MVLGAPGSLNDIYQDPQQLASSGLLPAKRLSKKHCWKVQVFCLKLVSFVVVALGV